MRVPIPVSRFDGNTVVARVARQTLKETAVYEMNPATTVQLRVLEALIATEVR